MKRTNYKLVISTDVENEVIEVKLLESLNWTERPKYHPIINLLSITKMTFRDIVDTMKRQIYKNIYWNFRRDYEEKYFMNNYENIMLEQFDEEDEIEVDIDYIIENLLGINVQEELAEHDELFDDLLDLALGINLALVRCNKLMIESVNSNAKLCFNYKSQLFDIEREHYWSNF